MLLVLARLQPGALTPGKHRRNRCLSGEGERTLEHVVGDQCYPAVQGRPVLTAWFWFCCPSLKYT